MANTHTLFQVYNQKVKLSDDKRNMLFLVRDSLRKRMQTNYMQIPAETRMQLELHFQSQGSVVMDTIITPANDDFDLDDGVYFQGDVSEANRPDPSVFHEWVIRAIDKDNEYEQVTDKPTCVRVQYKQGFHIDIPIYFATSYNSPDLAHTKDGWMLSNPIEFIAWFEEIANSGFKIEFIYESLNNAEPYEKWLSDIRKQDCQIRRLVRYLKAWADLDRNEMPCGIIMTILIANNFSANDRDDIAFRDTLMNVKSYLSTNGMKCPRPTSPEGEDLLAKTTLKDKNYFMMSLDTLIAAANNALSSIDERNASIIWNKVLGSRFPIIPPPEIRKEPNIDALKRVASKSTPWI